MSRIMGAIRGVYFWTILIICTLVCYSMILIAYAYAKLYSKIHPGRPIHDIAGIWSRSLITLMPGWKVELRGAQHLPQESEPLVIVANHESMADIWAIYYMRRQFRWLSKESVFSYPIVGHSMRLAGYVSVKRGDRDSHTRALAQSADCLRQGISMFFFPEGTRSTDGKIKPFKLGAFRLAAECGVRVLPVALYGAGKLLPKGSMVPGDATVRVEVLPAVAVKPGEEATMAESVRKQIVEAHERLAKS